MRDTQVSHRQLKIYSLSTVKLSHANVQQNIVAETKFVFHEPKTFPEQIQKHFLSPSCDFCFGNIVSPFAHGIPERESFLPGRAYAQTNNATKGSYLLCPGLLTELRELS